MFYRNHDEIWSVGKDGRTLVQNWLVRKKAATRSSEYQVRGSPMPKLRNMSSVQVDPLLGAASVEERESGCSSAEYLTYRKPLNPSAHQVPVTV
jgi:hypothetical protein